MDHRLLPHRERGPRAPAEPPDPHLEPGRSGSPRSGLRVLLHWVRSRPAVAAHLVTGPPGTGKTHLAHDLTVRLARRGWTVLHVHTGDDARTAAEQTARRLLLVVDDADTFPGLGSLLLGIAGREHGRTRLLLLARQTTVWRDHLEHGTPALDELLCAAAVLELPVGEPLDGPEQLTTRAPLTSDGGAVFTTAMLLGADDANGAGRSSSQDEGVVALALADDPRFATRVTTGLSPRQAVHAARMLARIMSAGPEHATADAVAGAYARVTAQLPDDPDVLGTFACHPQYLTGAFMQARVSLAERALALLDGDPCRRAALHLAMADALKYDGRYARALEAADTALGLLTAVPDAPAPACLEAAVATARALRGTLLWFRGRVEEALDDETAAFRAFRDLAAANPARYRAALAQSAMNVGSALAELGRAREALRMSAEGVELARAVGVDEPEQTRPVLAKGLWNLGKRHAELGSVDEAYRYTIEAVETCRELVRRDPYRYGPDLSSSLSYLGARLSELGRPAEAARATAEALELRRHLAEQHEGYLPFVAQTLSNLGILNAQLGRRRLGLEHEREAVALRRRLVASNPDRHLPDLAASLSNLGVTHSVLGNATEALAAEDEATGILRELASEHPERHLPGLVKSLSNLASRLAENGRTPDAVDPAEEAVAASRRLTEPGGAPYLPVLSTSLTNLAGTYADVGRYDDAVAAAREATDVLDVLARTQPEKYEPELALALTNLAVAQAGAGDAETALAGARRAAQIRSRLADQNPSRFQELAERSRELVHALEEGRAARPDGLPAP
ncbi:tetratricopeptide repeat protein [Myceligenerans indicum]|uniref:Tetratricopeptide repeat protein n=1 Tax=Myceligenerans indicum TaxID=2593663 RepID=A0ABS1LNM4_9MICO|nr:tetratricopeptide repeat protein [Myceligenerans indicum]MBL0887851.1 tetratricopeptide repeat protein [Myceligenerans indicum]